MRFTKMHGIGNDFIILNGFRQLPKEPGALAARLCDRHFGVGADGLILALPGDGADARMRVFNSDGSEAEMCGNGLRCLGRFLYDEGLCPKEEMRIETGAGVLELRLEVVSGRVRAVTADMGVPCFDPQRIPVAGSSNALTVEVEGRRLDLFCVGMGNPHAVTFDPVADEAEFLRLGALLERHPAFPRRANIEFCESDGQGGVRVRVWERGDGPTLACGTGACAVLAAGVCLSRLPRRAPIRLPGGTLDVDWRTDGHIYMTGPAEKVYTGEI